MGSVVLDASVVIGLIDPHDAHHDRAVADLEACADRRDDLVIASSAYAEALVVPLRQDEGGLVDGFVDEAQVTVVALDRALAHAAAVLRARHRSLRLADALALAVARGLGARLLTYDDRLGRIARETRQ